MLKLALLGLNPPSCCLSLPQKLRYLHTVAEKHGDSQMCDFVEGDLLAEQAAAVKAAAEKVAQLRRVGKGLGVYEFDRQLQA